MGTLKAVALAGAGWLLLGCSAKQEVTPGRASAPPSGGLGNGTGTPDLGNMPTRSFQQIGLGGVENLQSNLPERIFLDFFVQVAPEAHQADPDIESAVSVVRRTDGTVVAGAFEWGVHEGLPAARRLRFTPNRSLSAGEHVARIEPVGGFRADRFGDGATIGPGSHRLLFSVGSRLRLKWLRLISKDGGATAVYATWRFTESADRRSVEGAVGFTSRGARVPGKMVSAHSTWLQEFIFSFDQPVVLNSPVTVTLAKTAMTPGGQRLDPRSFDSDTVNQDGDLEISVDKGLTTSCGRDCFQWSPVVKW